MYSLKGKAQHIGMKCNREQVAAKDFGFLGVLQEMFAFACSYRIAILCWLRPMQLNLSQCPSLPVGLPDHFSIMGAISPGAGNPLKNIQTQGL